MAITAAEQYLVELINRARLDPQAEADRYLGGDINQNNTGTAFGTESRQVLAGNDILSNAAANHSIHMNNVDQFEHSGIGDGTPTSRAQGLGYTGQAGENISVRGSTGSIDLAASIESHHSGLFISIGHRRNILRDDYDEIGVGQEAGVFSGFPNDPTAYNVSMLTEKFGLISNKMFLTGVVYFDSDNDNFYSMGEGTSGAAITTSGGGSTTSAAAGGYAIEVANTPSVQTVSFGTNQVKVVFNTKNVKLDFVGPNEVHSSGDMQLVSGVNLAHLLGTDDLALTGSSSSDVLIGNSGDNRLSGGTGAGNDVLNGRSGADYMAGGGGNDRYIVDNVGDTVVEGVSGGTDIVQTAVNYVLSSNVENGQLLGSAGTYLVGNSGGNTLIGNSGANTLNGRAGSDRMFGYGGDDTYIVDSLSDLVGEVAGAGVDLVKAAVSYALSANVEMLQLLGTASINGIGNGLGNHITGNSGNNILVGGGGTDHLSGGSGNDLLRGGVGLDYLTGGSGIDTFKYFSVSESLGSSSARDRITDFTAGDKLDLSYIDANSLVGGNQAFTLDTGGSFAAGEIRQTVYGSNVLLEANVDGDAAAELSILLVNTSVLDAGDFIL